jgi:hypothetical protein
MHTLIAIAMNEHYEWAPIIRMTNEHYEEINLSGESVYAWDSWGGMMPISGYPESYLADWEETVRRAKRAHLGDGIMK